MATRGRRAGGAPPGLSAVSPEAMWRAYIRVGGWCPYTVLASTNSEALRFKYCLEVWKFHRTWDRRRTHPSLAADKRLLATLVGGQERLI